MPATFNYYNNYVAQAGSTLTLAGISANAVIDVDEVTPGTRMGSGPTATSASVGAVYTFEYDLGDFPQVCM